MKLKRKKWLRILLEELTQIAGQNSDMIGKHQRAVSEFSQRIQGAANDIRRAMTPDWLMITKGTKVDVHDISSVECGQIGDDKHDSWRIHMKNGVDFAVPVDALSEYAKSHPAFSLD